MVTRGGLGMTQAELARQLGAPVYGINILELGATSYPRADRDAQRWCKRNHDYAGVTK